VGGAVIVNVVAVLVEVHRLIGVLPDPYLQVLGDKPEEGRVLENDRANLTGVIAEPAIFPAEDLIDLVVHHVDHKRLLGCSDDLDNARERVIRERLHELLVGRVTKDTADNRADDGDGLELACHAIERPAANRYIERLLDVLVPPVLEVLWDDPADGVIRPTFGIHDPLTALTEDIAKGHVRVFHEAVNCTEDARVLAELSALWQAHHGVSGHAGGQGDEAILIQLQGNKASLIMATRLESHGRCLHYPHIAFRGGRKFLAAPWHVASGCL